VIYLDTSVALAHLLAEERAPAASLWSETLVSSRLLEYELWTRVNARKLAGTHGEAVRQILGRIAFLELTSIVLARAIEPFPTPVRTLDALHLASIEFLRQNRQSVMLATYDLCLAESAKALGITIASIG
jgi:predicted nucleic acid-binding protein